MEPNEVLQRLRQGHTRNVRFSDFEQLLEALGFIYRPGKGSHRVYWHPAVPRNLSIQPERGQAKSYQLSTTLAR